MTVVIHDADFYCYKVASAMEERYIEWEGGRWNNRKELEGELIKELGEEEGLEKYLSIRREIKDIQQQVGSVGKAANIVDSMIKRINREVGASRYKLFLEGSEDDGAIPLFRWEQAQMAEYKGNRKGALRPLLKNDIKYHLINNHPSELCVDGYEADDHVVIESYRLTRNNKKNILISSDKDARGTPCLVYNPDNHSRHNGKRFGNLYQYTKKGKKRIGGEGRMWLYFQVAVGDPVDNYKASCFSQRRWGETSAYKALRDCKNDKEAIKALINIYQYLYPESIEVIGWRGNLIKIDWLSAIEEIWMLARMKRWKGDDIKFEEIFNKMDINYG